MTPYLNKVAIITVGTEITDGQIFDKNSHWLSRALLRWPLQTVSHHSIPDDRQLIQKSLDIAASVAELIIVCGGLGPTSDDFTRDVISDWHKVEKEFHEDLWSEAKIKLSERGVTIREEHEKQFLLPRGSIPLKNNTGIAPGFYFAFGDDQMIVALPGPPHEIESIWTDHLINLFDKRFVERISKRHLYKFVTLGIPESEIAHITEKHFMSEKNLDFGYRLDSPFVETKLWFNKPLTELQAEKLNNLKSSFGKYYICDDLELRRKDLILALSKYEFCFTDYMSDGIFQTKIKDLSNFFKIKLRGKFVDIINMPKLPPSLPNNDFALNILVFSEHNIPKVFFKFNNSEVPLDLELPEKFKLGNLTSKLYVFEKIMNAIKKLSDS